MNDGVPIPANEGAARPDAAVPSFGTQLAEARKAMSLSVTDIAARLRINPKQVSAIEGENFAALPGPAYLRGFVRNYAKEVRLDAAPLIEALNRRLEPAVSEDAPARGPSPLVRAAERERISRTLVIVGAVVALIVFAVAGWISTRPARQVDATATSGKASAAPPMATAGGTTTGVDSAPPAAAVPASAPTPGENAAPIGAANASGAAGAAAATPGAEPGALRFGFRGVSWVEVTQQDGTVLLSQSNPADTEQIVRGEPPFKIVIGNASVVTLEYGGKSIDLQPVTSAGNVARLTLP
ncbi:MAG: helix-turn-helix domain-containing protein [Gemmatimonadota bacterium]